MNHITLRGSAAALLAALLCASSSDAMAECGEPHGDIDGSGAVSIPDVQCSIIGNLWQLSGTGEAPPACLGGNVAALDVDCGGAATVGDTQMVIARVLGMPLSSQVDADGDGCPNGCELPVCTPAGCNDANACTVDTCDAQGQCAYAPVACNDGTACTQDSCAPATGCVFTAVDCDDGNPCTADTCSVIAGCKSKAINCSDGDPCTIDTCVVPTGCAHAPNSCDDGNACTVDACNPTKGCGHTAVNCNDNNACTDDSCSPIEGCLNVPITCNDNSACTADSCNPASGCVFAPVSCPAANACTVATCDPVVGCKSSPLSCDDNNKCTTDACNNSSGCVYKPVSCNDNKPCTADSCNPVKGCINSLISCNDNNPCTTDTCSAIGGCLHSSGGCDDDDACTTDLCLAGNCIHPPLSCDDGNPCTGDSCVATLGCVHNNAICNDGNACTADICFASFGGACTNNPIVCNDSNPCTNDSCWPTLGCVYTPNNAACSDGNGCTTDLCLGGQCRGAIDDKRLMLRFESLSNGTTPDTSGMGSVVAALGNVVVAPGGSSGGASSASFPGNDATSAIRVPGAAITGKSFTFSAWVRPSVGGARYFVGRTSSASSNGLVLGVNGHLILHGTGITDGLAPLKVGDWTHLTLTYDGTTLRVYQNGLPSRLHPISSNASWTSDLWLGQEIDCAEGCTSASQAFGGRLDNVAWFNKVLTANEVGNLFRDQNIQCADDGFCTFDSCIGGSCLNTPTQSACDDGNPCTEDTCSAAGDCSYVRTVTLCEDDLPVENLWGGVWDNSGGDTEIVSDLTQTELVEAWNSGGPSGGQRLMDIEVRMVVGQPRFDALFRAGTGQSALWIYTQQAFLNQVITYNSGNLRLADFETFVDNGTRYYIGSWTHQPATGADTVLLGLTWDTLTAEHAARTNNGSRMVDLDVYIDNGALRYNAHFRPGAGPHGLIGTNWEHFSATVEGTSAALVDFEAIQFQGSWLYFGVWSGTDSSRRMVGGYGKSQFDDQRAAWEAQGYHLIDLERRPGEPVPPTEISASLWNTLKPYAMGFTYSVGKNGEPLGYGAQGLGRVAGNGASTNLPLNTLSRMHLASVSKTLSGAAWAVYNDQSGIDFDQPFWPWVSHRFPFADEDVKLMTFRQLLSHRGGFTDAQYYDACEPPLAVSVSVVLEIGPYEPLGEGDYTNSSTCIGRLLLEELTGVPYVQWVTTHVLSPSGAHDTTPTVLQSSTETLYYGNGGEPIEEYGFDDIFENFLDDYNNVVSAWGWYSSSRDLLNYLLALRNGDIVSEAAMNEMFTTEMGFFDIQTDGGTGYWHNGAWGGTYYVGGKEVTAGVATVAMHLPKGIDLVLLVNTQDINALDQAATAYDAWLAQNGGFVIQIPPIVDILP